jgi:hypothetical protein
MFYGDRTSWVIDPFGHSWYIHTHIKDVSPEEMRNAMSGAAIAALQPSDTGQACMMLCMRQLNLNVTPEFERDLRRLMRQRGISNKSDAIRGAVADAAARHAANMNCDFRSWLGLGLKAPLNPKPRFHGEDDLWS